LQVIAKIVQFLPAVVAISAVDIGSNRDQIAYLKVRTARTGLDDNTSRFMAWDYFFAAGRRPFCPSSQTRAADTTGFDLYNDPIIRHVRLGYISQFESP
jgi:hypothetical protein